MAKKCWLLLGALLLILVGGAYKLIVLGSVETAPDGRQALLLKPGERDLVLKEMRGFLVAVQTILTASEQNDMKAVADAASRVGMAAARDVPPTLMAKLPLAFKKLGFDTHSRFDTLALDARQLGDADHARRQLAELMGNCVACHAAYRIRIQP